MKETLSFANSALSIAEKLWDKLRRLNGDIKSILYDQEEITYDEAMTYFLRNRPNSGDVAKGAIIIEYVGKQIKVVQVFLDKRNNPIIDESGNPFKRVLLVNKMDFELTELFKNCNILIVE